MGQTVRMRSIVGGAFLAAGLLLLAYPALALAGALQEEEGYVIGGLTLLLFNLCGGLILIAVGTRQLVAKSPAVT